MKVALLDGVTGRPVTEEDAEAIVTAYNRQEDEALTIGMIAAELAMLGGGREFLTDLATDRTLMIWVDCWEGYETA